MYINNLRRIVSILCLLMTVCFSIHSQDTLKITITSDQLRTTNLIFAEHKEYSQLIPLLRQENTNLQQINETWIRTDSLKTEQLNKQMKMIQKQTEDLEKLKKRLSNSIIVSGTAVGVIIVTVVCLCLK